MSFGASTAGGAAKAYRNADRQIYGPRYTRATLAVILTKEWLAADDDERRRINAEHSIRPPTRVMLQRARDLFAEWDGSRSRGLPTPPWWTGTLADVSKVAR